MPCLGLLLFVGCAAKPAVSLDPSHIANEEAAILGHITATNRDVDETEHCYAEFQNTAGQRVAYLSMDESGWIMATVPPGPTRLALVVCTIYGGVTENVYHSFLDGSFVVPGHDKLAYFGHVVIAFNHKGKNLFVEALAPPMAKMFIPSPKSPPSVAQVLNEFEDAVAEYRRRFPESVQRLRAVEAVLTEAPPAEQDDGGETVER